MTDTKMRTLDTIQLYRQKLNFQSYPKPKKQFVCLYGKIDIQQTDTYHDILYPKIDSLQYEHSTLGGSCTLRVKRKTIHILSVGTKLKLSKIILNSYFT